MLKFLLMENKMKKFFILVCIIAFVGCGSNNVTVTIQPDGNKMAYSTNEFVVKAGQEVTLIMDNTATLPIMQHNIVILNDGSKADEVGQQAITAEGYLPDNPAIIAATPMAEAGAKSQTTFVAPTEPGEYVFICTYPGHYMMMRGVMIVQ